MSEHAYTVDIGPITTVLQSLICEDPATPITDSQAQVLAAKLNEIVEFNKAHPEAQEKILQVIGVQAFALLAQRMMMHFVAKRATNQAKDS